MCESTALVPCTGLFASSQIDTLYVPPEFYHIRQLYTYYTYIHMYVYVVKFLSTPYIGKYSKT